MLKTSHVLMASCLISLSTPLGASIDIPGLAAKGFNETAIEDKTLVRTGLKVNEDDIVADQNMETLKLTESQLHEAKVWGLSLDEEKRYVLLMQNRSGLYYKGLNLTPVDILGINARNDAERNHLAALGAFQEAQKISKNIAWNNAFYKAYKTLFQGVPVVGEAFDPTPYSPVNHKPIVLLPKDELYLFIKPEDVFQSIIFMLTDAVVQNPNTKLNLMLLDANEEEIQLFANKVGLSRLLVEQGKITLNQGDFHFKNLSLDDKKTPLLLLTRHGVSAVVNLGKF